MDTQTPAASTQTIPLRDKVCDGLKAMYPNLVQIAQELENDQSKKHYNPDHPATWTRISSAINPAGELKRLAVAFAIDFPDSMKKWNVSEDWNTYNSRLIKELESRAKKIGTNILTLGNKHELRPFIAHRCSHILGFDIGYVPIETIGREHELVEEEDDDNLPI